MQTFFKKKNDSKNLSNWKKGSQDNSGIFVISSKFCIDSVGARKIIKKHIYVFLEHIAASDKKYSRQLSFSILWFASVEEKWTVMVKKQDSPRCVNNEVQTDLIGFGISQWTLDGVINYPGRIVGL